MVTTGTVAQILAGLATLEPDTTVLTYYRAGQRESTWTAGRLLAAVHTARRRLSVGAGERVVIQSGNRPEFIVTALAVMASGAIAVPIAPDESIARAGYIVHHSRASLLVYDPATVTPADHGVPGRSMDTICDGTGPTPGHAELRAWDARLSPAQPATLLYTSGTTGRPKGVTLSHGNLTANAEALKRVHDLREGAAHICVLPLYHANAYGFSMITTLYAKGHLVLNDAFPLFGIREIVNSERAEIISVIPQIIRLWSQRPLKADEVPSLRYLVSAAAPLSVELARAFHSVTRLRIHQGYGLSECTNFATTVPHDISPDDYERVMHGERVPSIGAELYGMTCATVDGAGNELPEGVEGEIVVRGGSVMSGYWDDPEASAAALRGGVLHTGDLGFWRLVGDRRYFFVTGRIKELIIRAGGNLSPRELEDELDLPHDLAVVGFPHDAVGEEVGLYVRGPLSTAEQDHLLARLHGVPFARRPKVVVCGREPVPRTSTGKVRRAAVTQWFAAYHDVVLTTTVLVDEGKEGD
ncbi:class I adenylate-forming enzyme family protein [Streptosporangium sandarakinum]|uniref:class I adenylate-forming enzyme family protein n=1 Tax=Streptosporangium sandarakinum TaxID=1260955 RepID=UPI0034480F94